MRDRKTRGPRGVGTHHAVVLEADEITEHRGIPVTSPVRTIIDLASQADPSTVAKAYEEGLIRGLFTREDMIEMLNRHEGRRGIRKVRELVDRDAPPSVTIEEAHRRLLELIRSSDLPHPETEAPVGRFRVDLLWRRERVIVEMDGHAFHSTQARLEADKLRDAELAAMGYVVIRVTWRQLTSEPETVIARIRRTLAHRTARIGA